MHDRSRLSNPEVKSRGQIPYDGTTEHAAEIARLAEIADDSWYSRGLNTSTVEYCAEVFARFWKGPRCLEMGPAEGVMTRALARVFPDLTLVEGAESFCASLRDRFPRAIVARSLFENFAPAAVFDTIVLGHVLEHVENPVDILRRASSWLAHDGVLCCAVPNARSLHRQAAVILGLLDSEHAMNPTDLHHGHRRVYHDPNAFDPISSLPACASTSSEAIGSSLYPTLRCKTGPPKPSEPSCNWASVTPTSPPKSTSSHRNHKFLRRVQESGICLRNASTETEISGRIKRERGSI